MAGIPQVITEDRASGAQFIEGSLKFDQNKRQYLKRSLTADGNRRLWTWSGWLKRNPPNLQDIFSAGQQSTNDGIYSRLRIHNDSINLRQWVNGSLDSSLISSRVFRDTSAFFHFVMIYDVDNSTNTDKVRWYINGQRVTSFSATDYPGNPSWINSSSKTHTIGGHYDGGGSNADSFWDGHMSQVYFLDGIAAGPEEFGYTDPLTNTWRPKKFKHLSTSISTQYSGASALTWDDNPIGSVYTLSNGNRTATASGGSGYTGADVWSNAIPANSTTAWTLEITNSDSVGGWYFADAQTASGTHPDERGGNSMGLRNQDADAAFRGTFATANGYSNSGNQLSLPGCETFGSRRVDFVVYRPASGTGKVWVKPNGGSAWIGGGDPSNTSSTPSFIIPDGNTYFGYTFYDRSNGDQIATFDGDGSIQQKIGANSFYLPMDGNTPIGKDQSGNGNDWTPVGFGGSVELSKATGAIPIHNTNDAGTVAKNGVRNDAKTYTVTASGGNYYLDGELKPTLNAVRGGSYTFDYTGATSHPFYLSSLPDGKHNSKAYSVQFDGSGDYLSATGTGTLAASSDWCMECFFYCTGNESGTYRIMSANEASQSSEYLVMRIRLGQYQFSTDTANSGTINTAVFNEWTHMAFTKEGTTVRGFINGRKIWETTDNNTVTVTNLITGWGYASEYFPGFISNARFVNGSSVYTADFTPPTTSLTNITNTHLLCCQDNNASTGVIASGSITAAGNAAASQTKQPFLYNSNGDLGVNTGTSNTTKITIPHTAADTLYYYCSAHSGMGSSINVTTDILKADPYAWKCFFACPYAGDEFDVSDQINCNSTASAATNWNSVQGSNGATFYNTARYFAAGGSKNINYAGKQEFNFTGNYKAFTIEFFATPSSGSSDGAPISSKGYYSNYGNWYLRLATTNGGRMNFYSYDGQSNGQNNEFQNLGCTDPNRVHHVVVQRDGSNLMTFILDGVIVGQASNVTRALDDGSQSGLTVGRIPSNNSTNSAHNWYLGYITDLRIYSGLAKYSGSVGDHVFTPPSVTPDVLPDTPSGITGKINLTKITEGAVTGFESSSDYLSLSASSDFEFTGDHTIEMFIYHNTLAGDSVPFATGGSGAPDQIYISTTGQIYYAYGQTGAINSPAGTIVSGKWQHIAVSKQGTNLRAFVDGKMVAASTDHSSTIGSSSAVPYIGVRGASDHPVEGFISNLRVVKGTALYTANFTPPTEPLTAVTNTKLLCCQSPTSATAAAVAPASAAYTVRDNNGGTYWSGATLSNGSNLAGLFDESLATNAQQSTNGTAASITNFGPVNVSNTVSFYSPDGNARYTLNGGSEVSVSGTGWHDISFSGTLTSFTFQAPGNARIFIYGMKIDGIQLVDIIKSNGNAAATNFNPFTDDINTIRGQETGYATLNPIGKTKSEYFVKDGNLTCGNSSVPSGSSGSRGYVPSNIGFKTGKWYAEVQTFRASDGDVDFAIGIFPTESTGYYSTSGHYALRPTGHLYSPAGTHQSYGTGAWTDSDVIGIAVNMDSSTKTIQWFKNGTAIASALTIADKEYFFGYGSDGGGGDRSYTTEWNFGQKPFKFPPPDGFQPLSLSNVRPEKVIARPDQYVDVSLWTGNGLQKEIGGDKPSENATVVGGTLSNAGNAFNGSGANWATLAATNTSTAASVDFAVNLTGITRIEAAFDSPSGSGDTRGRYNGANAGNTRTGTGSGYSDIYNGSAITVTSVGFAINQNGTSGTSSDIVSRFRITDSQGTRFILDGGGEPLSFKPDFVWIKKRAGGSSRSHQLFDSVRGVYKTLHSDSASPEDNNTNRLTAFNQDGFAVGGDDGCNGSGGTFVGWTWKAGGNKNTFNIDDVGYANASDVNMNVAALNSVTFDKSQNWTSQITGTQNGSYPFANMFNGDGQATHAYPANGTRATFTPSPSFSNAKTVKVWYYAPTINANTFQLNGVNVGDQMTTTGGTLTKTFNVDGFTSWSWSKGVGGDDSGMLRIDVDGVQLVDSGVSTPDVPSIAPTGCSVGTKQGFSIIKYTSNGTQGATIPHGLTQKPDFAIFKNIDSTLGTNEVDWGVYHSALGATKNLELNQNLAEGTYPGPFNNTEPTSSVFTFGGSPNAFGHSYLTNGPSGDDFIAYIWHNVSGLQKFGSYINPSSTVSAFVELGFKPAVLIYKCARNISSSSGSGDWMIIDTTRSPVNNPSDMNNLSANVNNAEDGYYNANQGAVDILSNGFRIRHPNSSPGGDPGRLYIYAAWAEAPSINMYGAQSNAR